MIYLITGVPGSGKTLYAVSTLLQKLMAEDVVLADGAKRKRRVVVDGITGLVIPHESMAVRPEPTSEKDVYPKGEEGHGLWNWFEWCVPGDVIVIDEVQRHWRPRGMGVKPPPEIAKLETHRHLGVDFVIITQNPMLVDQNVRRLVGRHLHVRRLFGGARALIYDWDGCQADVHRTQGSTRSVWNYPKSAFKLYKSSELHTKQRQKIPLWMAFPLVVAALAVFAGPQAYSALSGSMKGSGVVAAKGAASAPAASVPGVPGVRQAASAPAAVLSDPLVAVKDDAAAAAASPVEYVGCIKMAARCKCVDSSSRPVDVDPGVCEKETAFSGRVTADNDQAMQALESPRPVVTAQADWRLIEALHGMRATRAEWGRLSAPSY